MNKRISFIFIAVIMFLTLQGCSRDKVEVSFDHMNGEVSKVYLKKGEKLKKPKNPEKENYIFQYWYLEEKNKMYTFNKAIYENTTLYAKYDFDDSKIIFDDVEIQHDGEIKEIKAVNLPRDGFDYEYENNGHSSVGIYIIRLLIKDLKSGEVVKVKEAKLKIYYKIVVNYEGLREEIKVYSDNVRDLRLNFKNKEILGIYSDEKHTNEVQGLKNNMELFVDLINVYEVRLYNGQKLFKIIKKNEGEELDLSNYHVEEKLGYLHAGYKSNEYGLVDKIVVHEDLIFEAIYEYVNFNFPILEIDTNDKQIALDKRIESTLSTYSDERFLDYENLKMEIRGRGNSTWTMPKKPYQLSFDERVELFGMRSAKKYVLLADYSDKSLMRNYIALTFAKYMNFEYKFEFTHVNLFLNNEYQGVYLLTEQVQRDKNRLEIEVDDRYDSGFFIEMDGRAKESGVLDIDWFEVDGKLYKFKNMNIRDYDNPQLRIEYIKKYVKNIGKSFKEGSYNEYVDVEQFIDYFIVQEILKNGDVNWSSVFMYKRSGEKLKMGPLWDFDLSLGNYENVVDDPKGFFAESYPWLKDALNNENFKRRYYERFLIVIKDIIPKLKNDINEHYNKLKKDAEYNFKKWDILNEYVWPNPPLMVSANTYEKQKEFLEMFLEQRVEWLNAEISDYLT